MGIGWLCCVIVSAVCPSPIMDVIMGAAQRAGARRLSAAELSPWLSISCVHPLEGSQVVHGRLILSRWRIRALNYLWRVPN
jgi:hypothetical protein